MWLVREERREHLDGFGAGETQIFGREFHRARRRLPTEEIRDERDVAVLGELAPDQRGPGRRLSGYLVRGVDRDAPQHSEGQIGLVARQRLSGDLPQRLGGEPRVFAGMDAPDQRHEHVRASRKERVGAAGVDDLLPQLE